MSDGKWHFITAVYTSGTQASIYIDGELDLADTSVSSGSLTPDGDLYIGRDGSSEGYVRFEGAIDDVVIIDSALSEAEILDYLLLYVC